MTENHGGVDTTLIDSIFMADFHPLLASSFLTYKNMMYLKQISAYAAHIDEFS